MAKTAQFDRQQAVDKATHLYWKDGYHATSMRSLQQTLDMRPGSIYAAFGSKDGLFKETLNNYAQMSIKQLQQIQTLHSSSLKALQTFVETQVIDSIDNAPNNMCMLSKTLGEVTAHNQEIFDEAKRCLADVSNALAMVIKNAQLQGEINSNKTCEELASHLQIQIAGMRTFTKVNPDKVLLQNKITEMFDHYPFK